MVLQKERDVLLKTLLCKESFKTRLKDIDSGGILAHLVGMTMTPDGKLHFGAKAKVADPMREPILYIPFTQIEWIAEFGE
jgi:hypothetical protein